MKITKGQLNEAIRRLLAGGNISTDSPVHAVDIDVLITEVGLDMLSEFVEEYRRREGVRTIPGHTLVRQTGVSVTREGERCYADLPFKVVDLPNDEGVFRVQRSGSRDAMVRVDPLYDTVYLGTIAGESSMIENFRIEGDRVYFGNVGSSDLASVDMLLLGIPNDQDATINVPAGWNDRLREIVLTRANLIASRPEDMTLNRKDDTNGAG